MCYVLVFSIICFSEFSLKGFCNYLNVILYVPFVGPKHCFGGPTTCGGEFTAEPTIDSCCFDMGSGGGFYKDADNMCIPCDSIGK